MCYLLGEWNRPWKIYLVVHTKYPFDGWVENMGSPLLIRVCTLIHLFSFLVFQGLAGYCCFRLRVQRTSGEATGGEGAQDAGTTPPPEGATNRQQQLMTSESSQNPENI